MTDQLRKKMAVMFAFVSLLWLIIGAAGCRYFSVNTADFHHNMAWLLGLWGLCLFDLFTLGKTVEGLLSLVANTAENRAFSTIQTFSWGFLKLVCLGIFILLMSHGKSIPTAGLLLGMGTLAIVPLVGGLGVFRNV
jgi:hypothetical protein